MEHFEDEIGTHYEFFPLNSLKIIQPSFHASLHISERRLISQEA
jgi:hypothetical protein